MQKVVIFGIGRVICTFSAPVNGRVGVLTLASLFSGRTDASDLSHDSWINLRERMTRCAGVPQATTAPDAQLTSMLESLHEGGSSNSSPDSLVGPYSAALGLHTFVLFARFDPCLLDV